MVRVGAACIAALMCVLSVRADTWCANPLPPCSGTGHLHQCACMLLLVLCAGRPKGVGSQDWTPFCEEERSKAF